MIKLVKQSYENKQSNDFIFERVSNNLELLRELKELADLHFNRCSTALGRSNTHLATLIMMRYMIYKMLMIKTLR